MENQNNKARGLLVTISVQHAVGLRSELEIVFTQHPEYSFRGSFYKKTLLYDLYEGLNNQLTQISNEE